MTTHVCIALICLAGGSLSGATGFGALIVMVPLLAFFLDLSTAVPLGVLCGVALQSASAFAFRTHVDAGPLVRMLLGSLPGVWLGSSLLLYMPEVWIRAVLGVLIGIYALWSLFGKHAAPTRPPAALWLYVAGFFSGAFGGAFGMIGPPAVLYATRTGWPPEKIRGFLGFYFVALFLVIAISQILHGLVGPETWRLAAWMTPVCLGAWLVGKRLADRLVPEQFMRLVFALLCVMGLSLCWPAARMLVGSVSVCRDASSGVVFILRSGGGHASFGDAPTLREYGIFGRAQPTAKPFDGFTAQVMQGLLS